MLNNAWKLDDDRYWAEQLHTHVAELAVAIRGRPVECREDMLLAMRDAINIIRSFNAARFTKAPLPPLIMPPTRAMMRESARDAAERACREIDKWRRLSGIAAREKRKPVKKRKAKR